MNDATTTTRPFTLALALSGGNALGGWQAGAYAALAARGYAPDRVSAASAGAINGAIIAGDPPDRAVERLRAFWSPAATGVAGWWPAEMDAWRRSAAAMTTLAFGRPDIFAHRPFLGQSWGRNDAPSPSLFDTAPLRATLAATVDWDRVNGGPVRLQIAAVDLETGEDVVFDSTRTALGPDHARASAALMPAFPPVEVDGRWCVDPGVSANLPLDALLSDPGPAPLLVVALDLLPLAAPRPGTIGEAAGRLQDLVFAAQARRTIDAWRAIYDLHGERAPAVTLARLSYADQSREVVGKAFDFSPESVVERWDAGRAAADAFLDALEDGEVAIGRPGLTVHQEADQPPLAVGGFRLTPSERAG